MELKQAQVFLAVADELHFGRAAEKLYMAQPPVTRIIKELERTLETVLFERSTRRVSLTPQGAALLEPARRLIDIEAEARRAVKAAALGESGHIRMAFAGVSTHVLISRLARRAKRERPGVSLELHSQNYAQGLMRRIGRKEVDIGFGRWDFIPPGIETRLIANEALVIAVPSLSPLANAESISMSQLRDASFISLPSHSGAVLTDRLERLGRAAGFLPEVTQIAPDTLTAMAMVAAEIGPSLTLSSIADHFTDPHVTFIPLRDETLPVQLRMAWRTEQEHYPALKSILELSEEEFPSPVNQ